MNSYISLILGLIVLIGAAEFLVRGASEVALRFKISPLVVGLTIVAFGTSAPELFISLKSALSGSPDLAVSNVVGSNICNIALILGVTALITPIAVTKETIWVNWPVAMIAALLLFIDIRDLEIQQEEGFLFVILIVFYNAYLIRKSRKDTKRQDAENNVEHEPVSLPNLFKNILFIGLGSIGLMYGADWMVNGAKEIALALEISERIIGITIVSLGTSLPELATSIVAALKNRTDLGIGNLIGSNVFNILSILGITASVQSIKVNELIAHMDMYWMLGITALLFPIMYSRMKVSRIEGAILISLYIAYITVVVI